MRPFLAGKTLASDRDARQSAAHACRRGVLLINLGTPDRPDVPAVRRYLSEFLADPQVIQLPSALTWLNKPLARLIARFRATRSAEMYRSIWTENGSPLMTITQDQASALSSILPSGWRVFFAMRYGQPGIVDTLREIEAAGIEELVVVPMYPQFSGATTGTTIREVYSSLSAIGHRVSVTTRSMWYDDAGYIYAQARLIDEYSQAHGLDPRDTFLVFSGHGLPVSYVRRGDPYQTHLTRTAKLVAERLGWPADRCALTYQSRLGPAEWLKPATDAYLNDLARRGEKRVMICPVSFTTDCLETLEEIDVRYREQFESLGGGLFLCPALNTFEPFVNALKDLVLHGSRPVHSWNEKEMPLLQARRQSASAGSDIDSLVMMGTSVPGRIPAENGPALVSCDPDTLRRTKMSQCEVAEALREVCESAGLREAFVWNTCCRFELYGWLDESADRGERERALAAVRDRFFTNVDMEAPEVNVLHGPAAWHHMLRTIAGLNSGLPGDRDIVEQLRTARRIAEYSGTAGTRTQSLIEDAGRVEEQLRSRTEWGRYGTGYCAAALSRIADSADVDFAESRIVVVGGSTTSRSILGALTESFGVSARQLTLVYRNRHGGQMKLLRKAIGNGRRLRVNSYTEDAVTDAIAEADVVCFGIDTSDPVLDLADLQKRRDLSQRPLTVIDFNTFGAVQNGEDVRGVRIWRAEQLDGEVSAFANRLCGSDGFARARDAAESWINERVLDAALNHTTAESGVPSVDSDRDHGSASCCRASNLEGLSFAGSVRP